MLCGSGRRRLEEDELTEGRGREERRERDWYKISMLVLSPNEVRGTRPISMASLDLRFIIWGIGTPEHR